MIPDIDNLQTFIEVARRGSYTLAAQHLGVSKSVASRRIAALEEQLQLHLLSRSTRGLALTEAGEAFFERCHDLLRQLEAACDDAAGKAQDLSGLIRITAPHSLGQPLVVPVVARLMRLHPRLDVEVLLDEDRIDLLGNGIDLAVRGGPVANASLQVRPLASVAGWVVASPAYLALHGEPASPAELAGHTCLYHAQVPHGAWRFESGAHAPEGSPPRLQVNSFPTLLGMAVDGVGLAVVPPFSARAAVANGLLRRVLVDHPVAGYPISALYPASRHLSNKVGVLLEALTAYAARPAERWGEAA